MQEGENKAIFLDRDGTINIDKDYLYKISDFEYIEGALAGLKTLSDMGYLLVIITNQSGIARGYYTEDDYLTLDRWLKEDLESKGIKIAGSYYCPHLPNGTVLKYAKKCNCRKPGTDLFWKAAKELKIDMKKSFAVGDRERDLSICMESGVKGFLLTHDIITVKEYTVCSDWEQIIDRIRESVLNS